MNSMHESYNKVKKEITLRVELTAEVVYGLNWQVKAIVEVHGHLT